MRFKGKLTKWNDDRGFGFIAPMEGGPEVFAHISAFPRDGRRPEVGEVLTYEQVADKAGRPRAVGITRPGVPAPARMRATHPPGTPRPGPRPSVVLPMVVIVLSLSVLGWEYRRYPARAAGEEAEAAAGPAHSVAEDTDSGRTCDERTRCSQMTSCEEATWFLEHCPGTKMDGNHDGVPCEKQWCGH
jgi:cold shock CspA family protein